MIIPLISQRGTPSQQSFSTLGCQQREKTIENEKKKKLKNLKIAFLSSYGCMLFQVA